MLSQRFANDGKAKLILNDVQLKAKAQVEAKIEAGVYRLEFVPCCVCSGTDFETLSEKDRYGLNLSVVICRKCGLIQTNPRMTQDAYASFYNSEYQLLYTGHPPGELWFQQEYQKGRRIYNFLTNRHIMDEFPAPFVIEVGCGTGGILQYFKEKGCKVKGVDLDEQCASYGREKHGLDISAGTIHQVSFDRQPDIILLADVLEHFCDPNKDLQYLRDLLRSSGVMYVEMPGAKGLLWSWRDFMGILQNAHTYHFSLTSLSNLMASLVSQAMNTYPPLSGRLASKNSS